jgi:periplasmic mercuric ion binding protein
MKTQYIVLSFLFVFAALFTVKAQKFPVTAVKKENIKVWGECRMCKKKIENASLTAGAIKAEWNDESKILSVSYNIYKTSSAKIQQAVAAAGYDTKDFLATGAAYNNLPACCHYQRKELAKRTSLNCCKDEMGCAKYSVCCKDAACDKSNSNCSDMTTCKEKGRCKS